MTKSVVEYLNEFLNEDPTRDAAHRVLARMGRDWTGSRHEQEAEGPTKPPKVDPERAKERAERLAKEEASEAMKESKEASVEKQHA